MYGLRLRGVESVGLLPAADAESWPEVRVHRRLAARESVPRGFGGLRACFDLRDGRLLLEREREAITTVTERPLPDDLLVHPWLTLAAAMWGRWLGRDCFHGGAFVADGGAWALLGEHSTGKSTLLAWLEAHARPVVVDDQVILEDGDVFAGPRCVDVRSQAASQLGLSDLPLVRGGERRRLELGSVAPRVALRGVIHLAWGDRVAVTRVPVPERIARLREHNSFPALPPGKRTLLDLGALPTFALRRPRDLAGIEASGEALLDALSG